MNSPHPKQGVPYFRPQISESAITEVVRCLESGWLTTGPLTRQFETDFAKAVGAKHAVALNSCTAALHLSVRALGLRPGQGVLVPTHTFAATSEIVTYGGGVAILVDCDPVTLGIDWEDAERKLFLAGRNELPVKASEIVGVMPVHYGGLMVDMEFAKRFAADHNLWIVEDAAHAFPAAYKTGSDTQMTRCGEGTANATCFSFYANKTITTGEGGMAVTNDEELAHRIRRASLHGLSSDAWRRYESDAKWDYRIVEAGFKYNLTDIASAIGLHQLSRAESMRQQRESIAERYMQRFASCDAITLPATDETRLHSWHLFAIRLKLEALSIDRNQFCEQLGNRNIGFSVHWRPLHLHPMYEELGWQAADFPNSTRAWSQLVSLPIFAGMTVDQVDEVASVVLELIESNRTATSPVT